MLKILSALNFRNLQIEKGAFDPKINVFLGENGQGKTNILEAIYFLSYAKTIRGTKHQVINWSSAGALVSGETQRDKIVISLEKEGETKIAINGKRKGALDLLGRFVSVLFHPSDLELLTGDPSQRRGWLDRLIATVDKNYLYSLVNYTNALKAKNKLLKGNAPYAELEVWDKTLVRHGSRLWLEREKWVEKTNQILKKISEKAVGKPVFVDYQPPFKKMEKDRLEKLFLRKLTEVKEVERKLKITFFGPHRDDFRLLGEEVAESKIISKDISLYGSRAEQRQASVLLKLAQSRLFSEVFDASPTLLLDDVTSELDEKNRRLLLANLPQSQVFVTTTSLSLLSESLKRNAKIFKVVSGRLESP